MINKLKTNRISSMKRRDKKTTSILGLVISDVERKQDTSDGSIIKSIQSLIKSNREFLSNIEAGSTKAQELVYEISVLEAYLPAQLSGAELRAEVESLCKSHQVSDMRGMGKVIGSLKKQHSDKIIDGAEVKRFVQEFIG